MANDTSLAYTAFASKPAPTACGQNRLYSLRPQDV
jgi:hypothetical protein